MARKSKSDNSGCATVIIFVLMVFITPIILLSMYIYYKYQFFKHTKNHRPFKGTCDDFWLSAEDKETWKHYDEIYSESYRELRKIEEEVEEQGIALNKDGSISVRSKVGKKLKDDFDDAKSRNDRAWDRIYEVMYVPQERWELANEGLRYSKAAFFGLVSYALGYVYLQLTYQLKINWSTMPIEFNSFKKIILAFPKIDWLKYDLSHLFILSIVVAIITALVGWIYSKPLKRITPFPPKVETDTVDLYEGKY